MRLHKWRSEKTHSAGALSHYPRTRAGAARNPTGSGFRRMDYPRKRKTTQEAGRTLSAGALNLFAAYRGGRWCMSTRLDEPSLDPPNVVFRSCTYRLKEG